jgi:hypothetical protein
LTASQILGSPTSSGDVLDVDDHEAEAMQLAGSVSPIVAE